MNPIKLLLLVIVYALVMYAVWIIVGLFPLAPDLKYAIVVVLAILVLLSLIYHQGWISGPPGS